MTHRKPDGRPEPSWLGRPDNWEPSDLDQWEEAKSGGRMLGWFLGGMLLLCVCGLIGSCVVAVWRAVP